MRPKKGQSYTSYCITTPDQEPLVMGIRPSPTKSAADTLKGLHRIVSDLNEASNIPNLGEKLITNTKSTMSDRAAACKLNASMLTEYRASLLNDHHDGYHNLSEQDKASVTIMYNFFCALHLLVNLADKMRESMFQYEQANQIVSGAASD